MLKNYNCKKQFEDGVKHKYILHFRHLTLGIPLHPGLLHLPFFSLNSAKRPTSSSLTSYSSIWEQQALFYTLIFTLCTPFSRLSFLGDQKFDFGIVLVAFFATLLLQIYTIHMDLEEKKSVCFEATLYD